MAGNDRALFCPREALGGTTLELAPAELEAAVELLAAALELDALAAKLGAAVAPPTLPLGEAKFIEVPVILLHSKSIR